MGYVQGADSNANLGMRRTWVSPARQTALASATPASPAATPAGTSDQLALGAAIGAAGYPQDPSSSLLSLWTLPSPSQQAKDKLKGIEDRTDKDLSAIDQAIADRTKNENVFQQMTDPVLKKLRAAKAELQKVKEDCQKAEQDLDQTRSAIPWIDPAKAGGPGAGVGARPGEPQQPDFGDAETQINDISGRLGRAESLLSGAFDATAPRLDGGIAPGTDQQLHDDIGQILGDVSQSQNDAQDARQNLYDAEDGNQGPLYLDAGSPTVSMTNTDRGGDMPAAA